MRSVRLYRTRGSSSRCAIPQFGCGLHIPSNARRATCPASAHSPSTYSMSEQRHIDGTDRVATDHLQGLASGFYAEYVPLGRAFGDHDERSSLRSLASQPLAVLHGLCAWLGIDLPGPETSISKPRTSQYRHVARASRGRIQAEASGAIGAGIVPGPLRERLRRVYLRFNAGGSAGSLTDGMRRRVDGIYEESNREMLRVLSHTDRPRSPWLEGRSVARVEVVLAPS